MKENKQHFETEHTITGLGDSLWGPSAGEFKVDSWLINTIDYREGNGEEPYELQLYGSNTEWYHYTDSQIESEVNEKILPWLKQQFPTHNIDEVTWSEQGMQPDNGWSFDIIIKS